MVIDAISVFYAARRARLFTGQAGELREYLDSLPLHETVRTKLTAALGAVGALERAGVPEATRRLVRSAMHNTWFCIPIPNAPKFFIPRKGPCLARRLLIFCFSS